MAKRKKRHAPDSAAQTLDEIEKESDRIAEWIDQNQMLLLSIMGGILVVAAIVGFALSGRDSSRDAAAADFAQLQTDYRSAMGAAPGAFEIAEPANPATALQVRNDFEAKFGELADAEAGTTVGALAAIEQARIQDALGTRDTALATLDKALDAQSRGAEVRSYLEATRASLLEDEARWADAAGAWEAAAAGGGPLEAEWLASAARCWADAGDRDKALAAWSRLEALDSPANIPPYVRARMEELEAAGA